MLSCIPSKVPLGNYEDFHHHLRRLWLKRDLWLFDSVGHQHGYETEHQLWGSPIWAQTSANQYGATQSILESHMRMRMHTCNTSWRCVVPSPSRASHIWRHPSLPLPVLFVSECEAMALCQPWSCHHLGYLRQRLPQEVLPDGQN